MIEIPRSTFKTDPEFTGLYGLVKKSFEVPPVAVKLMNENRHHPKGFGLQARQYFTFGLGGNLIYVRATADVWWQDNKICATIDKIGIYENFVEYETERVRDLNGAFAADNPNSN